MTLFVGLAKEEKSHLTPFWGWHSIGDSITNIIWACRKDPSYTPFPSPASNNLSSTLCLCVSAVVVVCTTKHY